MHDIRFVEDDWESPTLGAWGLGWEVWCDGMEVTQFTYFQQVGGFDCNPVSGEITYGLERLAMYVQGVDRVFDLNFNGRTDDRKLTYGDVFLQAEQEYSRFNFEHADTEILLQHFRDAEKECKALLDAGAPAPNANDKRHKLALPAYDQCIKASHVFNLLGRPRRDLRDRAAELHPARARAGQGLLRGMARDRGGRGVMQAAIPAAPRGASPWRGEEDAPRLSSRPLTYRFQRAQLSELSRSARQVGVSAHAAVFTPTRNAIGLSLPGEFARPDAIGSLSPWRSILPPQGGGKRARRSRKAAEAHHG